MTSRLLCLALPLLLAPPVARPSAQPTPVQITEWRVPWAASRPRDPYVGPQGRVWFVGQVGNYVAYLEPASGRFRRYTLEPGTLPHNLVVDGRGQVWYAGNGNGRIGRLDPAIGRTTVYPMPDSTARDPHTLAFGRTGDIWFTVQVGNFIGRLDTATGAIRLLPVPTARARPYGIVVDSAGRPWVAEFGSNKIATVDPATMRIREYTLPNERARPRRLAMTIDGAVWFVDYPRGMLGRLDTASGAVREWATPAGARARPYGMAVDDRNRLWFVETGVQPNRLVGFDPRTSAFFSVTPISTSGGGTVRHMVFHRPTRTIWFGTDSNTIARAAVP